MTPIKEKIKVGWIILILTLLCIQKSEAWECLHQAQALKQEKEIVVLEGGAWESFEKDPQLKANSIKGLKLDAGINQIVELSDYLCKTLEGVPLNELATYVLGEIKNQGEKRFREQLRGFGKPEDEIESWFRYSKIAFKIQTRTLDNASITQTLLKTQKLIVQYKIILKHHRTQTTANPLLLETHNLMRQIENFLMTDPNMVRAVYEKAVEPYWDPDENYGGS